MKLPLPPLPNTVPHFTLLSAWFETCHSNDTGRLFERFIRKSTCRALLYRGMLPNEILSWDRYSSWKTETQDIVWVSYTAPARPCCTEACCRTRSSHGTGTVAGKQKHNILFGCPTQHLPGLAVQILSWDRYSSWKRNLNSKTRSTIKKHISAEARVQEFLRQGFDCSCDPPGALSNGGLLAQTFCNRT